MNQIIKLKSLLAEKIRILLMFDCSCFIERWFLKIEDMQKYYVFDIMRLKVKAGLIQF